MEIFNKFYLDKEKDIIVNLYKINEEEMEYVLETPNHNSGNLITNLSKLFGVQTVKNEKDMKVIKGVIPASINGNNEEVYIFRLGGMKIANIYATGEIELKVTIPAISKTLMSQTKDYKLDINKTMVKSYIFKKSKFRTDLHTHMNANLKPDVLIALGIKHQVRYPLYYIKKLNLKLNKLQEKEIYSQRKIIEKQFETSTLTGKNLIRRIDDNTFINFADFILNNIENAEYNISKIRSSLSILKDGQAVFTNLEKVYLYRYVFCKGISSDKKINISNKMLDEIPDKEIKEYVISMIKDLEKGSGYEENTLFQDKLLWISREYKKQGIFYTEIADTTLVKLGEPGVKMLEEVHEILPKAEKETGVEIRFLAAIRRIPLTIIKDAHTSTNYLRENLDALKAIAKDPYVVGSDFIGEEINDISELKPVIAELVKYVAEEDSEFTIRIHAGENDSLINNVEKSIQCVSESLLPGQAMPQIRLGHGLHTPDLNSEEGKQLVKLIKETNTILEFQLTSNVRLNNLIALGKHPIREYLKNDIKCVQGTDGCGFYGVDTIDEQLALSNLLEVTEDEFQKMRKVEDELIKRRKKYFKDKNIKFKEFLNGRSIREAILQAQEENISNSSLNNIKMRINSKLNAIEQLKEKIKELPENKVPIIIAGGSFNSTDRETQIEEDGRKILETLIDKVNEEKVYFVIGHKIQAYEKAIIEIIKEKNKNIEVYCIIPRMISKQEKERLENANVKGIRISTESQEMGIYKSFNYEIFERRNSIVIAFDGNSPVANLVQEAKNGKGKAKIYVNKSVTALKDKARSLKGYVTAFNINENIVEKIIEENPEII